MFECPYCGEPLEDPGEAFVEHAKSSPDCREQYEHTAESTAEEWARR